jgi:tetratricopeptide (TPR) repeat protein
MQKFVFTGVLVFLLVVAIVPLTATALTVSEQTEGNVKAINHLFAQQQQELSYLQRVTLPSLIIKNRKKYSKTTIAKAFSLLADAAFYKGDSARAFQFAQDGLAQDSIEQNVQLDLLLKVAAGYYEKGKYKSLLKIALKAINLAQKSNNTYYLLNAYAYQAAAYALLGQYNLAYRQLQLIDDVLTQQPDFSTQVELVQILALAHHNLGHYQTALTLYLKLLKLQFDLSQTKNIAQTYYNLALTYLKLTKYNDAYNAFWQMKLLAEKKSAPILLAYAELGIGKTLFQQNDYKGAYASLLKAEKLFKGQNLSKAYLSNLIALAQVAIKTKREVFAGQILRKAQTVAANTELTREQIKLYKMLSANYQQQQDYNNALLMLTQYVQLDKKFQQQELIATKALKHTEKIANKSEQLALKISEKSSLYTEFHSKNQRLRKFVWLLFFTIVLLMVVVAALWIKHRRYLQHIDYTALEQPLDYMPSPIITKKNYQQCYKKSRKYNYPLTVAYLKVVNWSELLFHFKSKVMADVANTLACIINENTDEFVEFGLIAPGEYILLYPHQTKSEISEETKQLVAEISARFFANLGDFSVTMDMALATADVQDIDPFVFLAQLSNTLNKE